MWTTWTRRRLVSDLENLFKHSNILVNKECCGFWWRSIFEKMKYFKICILINVREVKNIFRKWIISKYFGGQGGGAFDEEIFQNILFNVMKIYFCKINYFTIFWRTRRRCFWWRNISLRRQQNELIFTLLAPLARSRRSKWISQDDENEGWKVYSG